MDNGDTEPILRLNFRILEASNRELYDALKSIAAVSDRGERIRTLALIGVLITRGTLDFGGVNMAQPPAEAGVPDNTELDGALRLNLRISQISNPELYDALKGIRTAVDRSERLRILCMIGVLVTQGKFNVAGLHFFRPRLVEPAGHAAPELNTAPNAIISTPPRNKLAGKEKPPVEMETLFSGLEVIV